MLVRFKPVESIFEEIDSIVNSALVTYPTINRTNRFSGVSMKDTGEQVLVNVEIPGVVKEDVKVNVNDGVLTILAERKQPKLKENEQWIRNEISYGAFERAIKLPYSVDVEKISATHENGLLQIVLPKHENAKPKQISIR
ncbi:MAG: Hsp20/alpha crystallin family protein [Bacteroidota bacterium]|nr:Hsp20/alpha crystallin family protein [Bacteroidota bacterium]